MLPDLDHIPLKWPLSGINLTEMPLVRLQFNDEDVKKFNELYLYAKDLPTHDRSKSGGISLHHLHVPSWSMIEGKAAREIVLLCAEGQYRVVIGARKIAPKDIPGRAAFHRFRDICQQFGIDIDSYAIDNGLEIKQQIQKPHISISHEALKFDWIGQGANLNDVHHMDINSAFMAGIAHAFPDLYGPINYIYMRRKEDDPINKAILTHSYGFMQSQWCVINGRGYALSHLSKAALDWTNNFIEEKIARLRASARTPILTNTDGIWYTGKLYQDEDEGYVIGRWKHDHKNCLFNMRSVGCYQYIENGIYYPVVRGYTGLDQMKPRNAWIWDDIYRTSISAYRWTDERGYVPSELEEYEPEIL